MVIPMIFVSRFENNEEADLLRQQGVDMDDWDYIVLIEEPDKILKEGIDYEYDYEQDVRGLLLDKVTPKKIFELNEEYLGYNVYNLDKLLNCSYNKVVWHKVKFNEIEYACGVSYH